MRGSTVGLILEGTIEQSPMECRCLHRTMPAHQDRDERLESIAFILDRSRFCSVKAATEVINGIRSRGTQQHQMKAVNMTMQVSVNARNKHTHRG